MARRPIDCQISAPKYSKPTTPSSSGIVRPSAAPAERNDSTTIRPSQRNAEMNPLRTTTDAAHSSSSCTRAVLSATRAVTSAGNHSIISSR